jgi:branched-subunit amino acid permease
MPPINLNKHLPLLIIILFLIIKYSIKETLNKYSPLLIIIYPHIIKIILITIKIMKLKKMPKKITITSQSTL